MVCVWYVGVTTVICMCCYMNNMWNGITNFYDSHPTPPTHSHFTHTSSLSTSLVPIPPIPRSISMELHFDFFVTDNQWEVIFNFLRTSFIRDFGRHVTMWQSDWPELFGTVRTKESKIRGRPFRSHSVSGSSRMRMSRMRLATCLHFLHSTHSCPLTVCPAGEQTH